MDSITVAPYFVTKKPCRVYAASFCGANAEHDALAPKYHPRAHQKDGAHPTGAVLCRKSLIKNRGVVFVRQKILGYSFKNLCLLRFIQCRWGFGMVLDRNGAV